MCVYIYWGFLVGWFFYAGYIYVYIYDLWKICKYDFNVFK